MKNLFKWNSVVMLLCGVLMFASCEKGGGPGQAKLITKKLVADMESWLGMDAVDVERIIEEDYPELVDMNDIYDMNDDSYDFESVLADNPDAVFYLMDEDYGDYEGVYIVEMYSIDTSSSGDEHKENYLVWSNALAEDKGNSFDYGSVGSGESIPDLSERADFLAELERTYIRADTEIGERYSDGDISWGLYSEDVASYYWLNCDIEGRIIRCEVTAPVEW